MSETNDVPQTKRKREKTPEDQEQTWRKYIMKKLEQYDAPPKKVEKVCEKLINHIKKTEENVYVP